MFFRHKGERFDKKMRLIMHKGIFRRQITMFEAVALIVSATIGAGMLGIPFAIAKVGLTVGMAYIIGVGILMIGLNLLIGEIAVRTRGDLQFVGLARKYLGKAGEVIMVVLRYVSGAGVLVIYIIGVGQSLFQLFGGSCFMWSVAFAVLGMLLLFQGMRAIKVADFFLSMAILFVVLLIAALSVSHIKTVHWQYINWQNLLFPYGVILFAYSGGSAVLEAHSILTGRKKSFKTVIILAGLICMAVYAIFSLAVLGVTGVATTEIATIGLGRQIGPLMFVFGNVFAILAMSTCFLTHGLSLRDSLVWDYKMKEKIAVLLIGAIPLVIFLLGLRQFIAAISIVGGIFVGLEMLMVILIYWKAKQTGDLKPGRYRLHHSLLLIVLLLAALTVGVIYSVAGLF